MSGGQEPTNLPVPIPPFNLKPPPQTQLPAPQLPDDTRRVLLEIKASLIAEFLGPFPSPDTLARFEQIVPGSAARIISMAESQTAHRQGLERTVIDGDGQRAWYGLWFGFTIGMSGVIGSVILGLCGHPVLGGIFVSGTLVSLASVFVVGNRSRRDEREEKRKAMTAAQQAQQKPPASPPA